MVTGGRVDGGSVTVSRTVRMLRLTEVTVTGFRDGGSSAVETTVTVSGVGTGAVSVDVTVTITGSGGAAVWISVDTTVVVTGRGGGISMNLVDMTVTVVGSGVPAFPLPDPGPRCCSSSAAMQYDWLACISHDSALRDGFWKR